MGRVIPTKAKIVERSFEDLDLEKVQRGTEERSAIRNQRNSLVGAYK